jgi:hypothetical protein
MSDSALVNGTISISPVLPRTFSHISCITPAMKVKYSNAWVLLTIEKHEVFFNKYPRKDIASIIKSASTSIYSVGIESAVVESQEYAMLYIQGVLGGSEFTHESIRKKLDPYFSRVKMRYLTTPVYILGTIKNYYPSDNIQSLTTETVQKRVKGNSSLEISDDDLLVIPAAALTHAQARMTVIALKKQLDIARAFAYSREERLQSEITELTIKVKSGSSRRVLAEFFYKILQKRDEQTQRLVMGSQYKLLDGSIKGTSIYSAEELSQRECQADACWWVKEKFIDSADILQGEMKELFIKAWCYSVQSLTWGCSSKGARDGRVIQCNDYAIIHDYWTTRPDFEWPEDLQDEDLDKYREMDVYDESRTREDYIRELESKADV